MSTNFQEKPKQKSETAHLNDIVKQQASQMSVWGRETGRGEGWGGVQMKDTVLNIRH